MTQSVLWFTALVLISGSAFFLGKRASQSRGVFARIAVVLAVALLCLWGWLEHHPVLMIRLLPTDTLSYLEGTAGAPLFMLILGIAWSWSRVAREKKFVLMGLGIGAIYFLRGGIWMVETTPENSFAAASPYAQMVMQSQDFSCGPAACATVLHYLGIKTTEAEMAQVTQTRAGSGTTMIRTLDGLNRRLASTPWQVDLLQPAWDEIQHLPTPALALMRFQLSQDHMVAVLKVTRHGILIADPVDGRIFLPRDQFERVYAGQMLVFTRRSSLALNQPTGE